MANDFDLPIRGAEALMGVVLGGKRMLGTFTNVKNFNLDIDMPINERSLMGRHGIVPDKIWKKCFGSFSVETSEMSGFRLADRLIKDELAANPQADISIFFQFTFRTGADAGGEVLIASPMLTPKKLIGGSSMEDYVTQDWEFVSGEKPDVS